MRCDVSHTLRGSQTPLPEMRPSELALNRTGRRLRAPQRVAYLGANLRLRDARAHGGSQETDWKSEST